MTRTYIRALIGGAAAIALLGAAGGSAAFQQGGGGSSSGGGGSHASGSTHDSSSHADQTDHQSGEKGGSATGSKGSKGKGGASGQGKGGQKSMEDIFRDVGAAASAESDSDRPAWAGVKGGKAGKGGAKPTTSGSKKGDLYGDQWVILRDANGVPILNADGFVQPLDASGNLIPLDAEGAPIDPTLTVEVALERLNVSRAGSQVLDRRASEVVTMLKDATAISLDPAGRLVVTVNGVANTIDSPLENLAIYVALMTTGTIPGVSDLPGTQFDNLVDGKLTAADMESAKAFLAAASDKTSPISTDEVAYLNTILGINTKTTGTVTYSAVDYSKFTYDRSDTYANVTATVLVKQTDGSYKTETVNVYDAVFGGVDYTSAGTLATFAQAADDSRAVVNYLHENEQPADTSAVPTAAVTTPSQPSTDKKN